MTAPIVRQVLRRLLLLLLLPTLSACGAVCGFGRSGDVTVVAAPDANGSSATAVDLVVVTTEQLANQLVALDAVDYFAARPQLIADNPVDLTVTSWEVTPSQSIGPNDFSAPCGTDAVFVFASYSAPGSHRAKLAGFDDVVIELGPDKFEVTQ
ncbi:MAG: hypothetical protein AAF409_12095 [Pseudomonadota bacterium]